jgi:nucleotide-binding universal stress UspA family protein
MSQFCARAEHVAPTAAAREPPSCGTTRIAPDITRTRCNPMAAAAQPPEHALRKILIPVDDTDDSEAALVFLLQHMHRNGSDELHFMHVLPFGDADDFAAVYGVPPVDYIPTAASEQQKRSSVAAAERWLWKRFVVGHLPADLSPRPIIHIVKVGMTRDAAGWAVVRPSFATAPDGCRAAARSQPLRRRPLTPPLALCARTQSETSRQHIGELICRKAQELGAAAVVMSTHNKGRLQELFLGSSTNVALHHCAVPLVVVPPAWRPQLEPQGPALAT